MADVLLALDEQESWTACEAIARKRFWSHCECEPDVGWTCGFCKHWGATGLDIYEEVVPYYADWLRALFRVRAFLEAGK